MNFDDHRIEVKNVSFGYHDDKEILHGITLSVPQNGMTALVGPSGSGKSTLAKLIAGFWDVKQGTITMGGHSLPLRDSFTRLGDDRYHHIGETDLGHGWITVDDETATRS